MTRRWSACLLHTAKLRTAVAQARASLLGALLLALAFSGCAGLPPGAKYPKSPIRAPVSAQDTNLGRHFEQALQSHGTRSAFRIISVGVDGFLARIEMINKAERALDLQYYIFRGDESGTLVRDALARAAARGVQVRILVDDADTRPGDERLFSLGRLKNVEVRVYNPWAYRGHLNLIRDLEYVTHHRRLDYRMHNKLLIVDDAVALVGGRNIGDQYFQIDPQSQFADDDVFTTGPAVKELEQKFNDFWASEMAIPSPALEKPPPLSDRANDGSRPRTHDPKLVEAGFRYADKLASGEPFAAILDGRLELTWADALVVCDPPMKKDEVDAGRLSSLMYKPIAEAIGSVQQELLLTTPYLVPSKGELNLIHEVRSRKARVRALTNSLRSAPEISAHAGYMHYRPALLKEGVELYEVRSKLDNVRGSGQSKRISNYGNYALHGKIIVFDRKRVYLGSMNFDRRSRNLNTEIGLIIDSPTLSQEMAARFESMTQLESAYAVVPVPGPHGAVDRIKWRTREDGKIVEYDKEPARSAWQRFEVHLISLLPLDEEL